MLMVAAVLEVHSICRFCFHTWLPQTFWGGTTVPGERVAQSPSTLTKEREREKEREKERERESERKDRRKNDRGREGKRKKEREKERERER